MHFRSSGGGGTTTLKLGDGVTSLGRHDDCIIRIKSSQVSRKHCELFEAGGKLTVRDLGSSNGTFVNGKRVLGQQPLKVGDELTVGSITLRVATLGQPVAAAAPHKPAGKPGDTAVVEAVAIEAEEENSRSSSTRARRLSRRRHPPGRRRTEAPAPPAPKKAAAAPAAPNAPAAEKAAAKPAGKGKTRRSPSSSSTSTWTTNEPAPGRSSLHRSKTSSRAPTPTRAGCRGPTGGKAPAPRSSRGGTPAPPRPPVPRDPGRPEDACLHPSCRK